MGKQVNNNGQRAVSGSTGSTNSTQNTEEVYKNYLKVDRNRDGFSTSRYEQVRGEI